MASTQNKLFLLDAMALIYRAHFAFIRNPRINSKGMNTSAVYGFTTSLLDILNKEKPTHIGIVYDTSAPTFRHIQYNEYKANRQQKPEDISIAEPYIMRIAEAMGIPNVMLDGYEADDIIGTIAKQAACDDLDVFMMTPDKDYAQLVSTCIFQYKPSYMGKPSEVLGVKDICKKWEIDVVEQVIDILGLMGDSIDNIPGVPGVGEKTAKKLIQQYGSVENIIAHSNEITGKLGESIRNFAQQALLSKELATINTQVPIKFDIEDYSLTPPDLNALTALFAELEFRALNSRFLEERNSYQATTGKRKATQGDLFSTEPAEVSTNQAINSIENVNHDYKLITTAEQRTELITNLKKYKEIAFDTETSDLSVHVCDLVGFSFAAKAGEAFYVAAKSNTQEIVNEFKEILEDENILIIGQNIKYDYMVLKKYGVEINGQFFDTMIAHYLIEPDMRHNLDFLCQQYLQYSTIPIESLIGKGRKQLSMADLDPEIIKDYACEDADLTLQLYQILKPELKKVEADKLFREVEMPLIKVLADIELEGIRIDKDALDAYSEQLLYEMRDVEASVYELAGQQFNINSPMQLGEILFERLKLDPNAKRTQKSKQYSTNEEVLSKLAARHDIAQKILDYRSLQKLKSTYVDALPLLINKRTLRVHTSFNQAVAATGRLSSTDPNLQNIPIRTERGREIRKAFIPRNEKHILVSADYSQIELRLIAEISGDKAMTEAFMKNWDIHTATAARIYGISEEGVTPEMRRRAKMVNFGIIYGISAFGLAQRLNISRSEAAEIIAQYNRQFPGIREYLQNMIKFATEHGYVKTLLGRRRYLRDINSGNATQRGYAERNAINAPIQGSAADMIKIAMVDIHKAIKEKGLQTKMVLQVHDELVFDTPLTEKEVLIEMVKDKMKNALTLKIPIEVEAGAGANWLEAH
jgi:DNA polymerase-1